MSIKKVIFALFCVVLMAGGVYIGLKYRPAEQVQKPLPQVDVVRLKKSEVYPELSFVAKTESQDKVSLRARVTGFLQERLFNEGDVVSKDQPLFVIEQVNFEANVRSAQANYDKALAAEKNATLQYESTKKLYKSKDVSKSKLDEVEANYTSAKSSVNQMKAMLDLAQKDLEYTVIKAPMDGKIGESTFSVGELIGPSSGVLAVVVKINPMDVVFSVSENQLSQLRREMPDLEQVQAQFVFSDDQVYDELGTVDFTDVALDEQMNTLKMKATFENPKNQLISGQYGRVVLKGKTPVQRLLVPQKSVQRNASQEFVLVVKPDNTIEKRTVQTGMEFPDYKVEILDGLADGEVVVVEGFQKVAPGAKVETNVKQ